MRAKDIMTPQVATVSPEASVEEAARLMLDRRISGLPVVDAAGAVVGLVTEGDLLRPSETGTDRSDSAWLGLLLGQGHLTRYPVEAQKRCVSEIMTRKVFSVTPDRLVVQVLRELERHRVKRLLVMDDNRLVGIISRANLLKALAAAST
jgi:CBS domain-containing protein